ncbi:unnamed protein product, partial [Didymodactylos carnosus]
DEEKGSDTEQRPPPARSMSLEMAQEICRMYLDNYLSRIPRLPQQRSVHYNSTIQGVYDACVFDVEVTGIPSVAEGSIEALMIEQLTTDSTNMESLYNSLNAGLRKAIDKEIGPVAKEILEVQGYDTSLSLARNNDDVFVVFNNDIRDLAELRKQVGFDVKNGDDVKFEVILYTLSRSLFIQSKRFGVLYTFFSG